MSLPTLPVLEEPYSWKQRKDIRTDRACSWYEDTDAA